MWWMLVGLVLTGCGWLSGEDRPKILLDTAELRTRYMTDHDEIIRQGSAAVLRCRATPLDAPLVIRTKCRTLDESRADWEKHDLIIRDALIYDASIRATDFERALVAGEKYKKAAQDVMGQK